MFHFILCPVIGSFTPQTSQIHAVVPPGPIPPQQPTPQQSSIAGQHVPQPQVMMVINRKNLFNLNMNIHTELFFTRPTSCHRNNRTLVLHILNQLDSGKDKVRSLLVLYWLREIKAISDLKTVFEIKVSCVFFYFVLIIYI